MHHDVASSCCTKLAEMTLEVSPYELTVAFECCILETMHVNSGKLFTIFIWKMYQTGKKKVVSSFVTS
jgi:hypothetical protein